MSASSSPPGWLADLFGTCFAFTTGTAIEGKYSRAISDSGNWFGNTLIGSKYGVSAPAAASYLKVYSPNTKLTAAWMEAMPLEIAQDIGKHGYWDAISLDVLAPISQGLCLSVWDHGYNRGPLTSVELFQALIGMAPRQQTGVIGGSTLAAYTSVTLDFIAGHMFPASVKDVQAYLGVSADGAWGPKTSAAALAQSARNVVTLYALRDVQVTDYKRLPGIKVNPGWLTRADARLHAALALESHI